MTLEDYLRQDAQRYPGKVAAVCDGRQMTYSELYAAVCDRAQTLPRGQVIAFRSSQSIDFLITYFAIHLAGSIAAPLERDTPEPLYQQIANLPRPLQRRGVPTDIRHRQALLPFGEAGRDFADILYTTGTTGRSKGAIVSHRAIIANAENLIEGQGYTHDLVFIVSGPLNHIGSLSKVWPVVLTGGTLYILEGMKDLEAFFRALDYPAPKAATFLVPATIRMLLQLSGDRLAAYAHRLDFIESGAAPLPRADMLRLCQLLPQTRLYNTYASTETGIIATYNYNDGRCLEGCLGRPMSHSRVTIIPEQSSPIPAIAPTRSLSHSLSADGLIACQGDTLMSGYAGDSADEAPITILTSDLGYLDAEGMLHLTGRRGDTINVGGYKVAPTEVEAAAMLLPQVSDCICIAAPHSVVGTALKLLVVTADGIKLDKRSLARSLATRLEGYKVPQLYEQVESVRRTYNGKLDRKYYRQQDK
jgi:acyl-CoA synthetase (AMP-forming)/AMP-acid ligase II